MPSNWPAIGSKGASETEEGSRISLKTGRATTDSNQLCFDIQAAGKYCKGGTSDGNREGEKEEVDTNCSWVPYDAEEEKEGATQPQEVPFPPGAGKTEDYGGASLCYRM